MTDRYFRPWLILPATLVLASFSSMARADILVGTFNGSGVVRYTEHDIGTQTSYGQVTSGSGGLNGTTGVAVGPDGNIYVASRNTGQILRYEGSTGQFLNVFATMANNPNPAPPPTSIPASPVHVAFGPDGFLYVGDSAAGAGGTAVERYRVDGATGTLIDELALNLNFVGGFTFAANGDLLVSDFFGPGTGNASVVRLSKTGMNVNGSTEFASPTTFVAAMTSPMQTPGGMLIVNNQLWVSDLYGNSIVRYSAADGTYLASDIVIPPELVNDVSNFPQQMIFDRTGEHVLLAVLGQGNDLEGKVLRYNLDGTPADNFIYATGLPAASSLAIIGDFLEGDFSGDGFVGQDDLNLILGNWGAEVAGGNALLGDGNGDGFVGQDDLNMVLGDWGQGDAPVPIPEPATVVLMGLAGVGLVALRLRSRRAM